MIDDIILKLKGISLDQWQRLDGLHRIIAQCGLNVDTIDLLTSCFEPMAEVGIEYIRQHEESLCSALATEDNHLLKYCAALTSIIKIEGLIDDDPYRQKALVKSVSDLLEMIEVEYPVWIEEMIDFDSTRFKQCRTDNLYVKYYRYLQGKWLLDNNLPVKKEPGQRNSDVYGNYTSSNCANFMTSEIVALVDDELKPENKGDRMMEEYRLRHNLLSSQPLCFNLFGELKLHLDKASEFFNILYNGYFQSIDNILFEYNPQRRSPQLTGDRSAFDVFVEYTSKAGRKGFIGIEMKYAETLKEGAKSVIEIMNKQFCDEPRTRKDRYEELSKGLFSPDDFDLLEKLPRFQIWRDHLLAVSMCMAYSEQYDEGMFLFLSPYTNKLCRQGVMSYSELLLNKNPLESHFHYDWLEDYIDALHQVFKSKWTESMAQRYLGRNPQKLCRAATRKIITLKRNG